MDRVPEPELMLDPVQAAAYAGGDFAEPHSRFVALLLARHPVLPARGRALDLGCGPGDVTLRLARALPAWHIDALDGSPAMLELARRATGGPLRPRLRFHRATLPDQGPPGRAYDLVVSNSLLHHLRDPRVLWTSVARWGGRGCAIFVMDLARPDCDADARALVERYASAEPDVLRTDFYNSLRAAYRPEEVGGQLADAGVAHLRVEVVSDRHLVVWGRR
jgi:SAM-dependent methyltransferase